MIFPDCRPVVEVWLVSCGFTEARPLALKMTTFFKLINEQVIHNVMKNSEATLIVKRFSEDCCPFFFLVKVSCQPQYSFGLRSMKMVTMLSGKQLQGDMAKKRPNKMSCVTEESPCNFDGDAGTFFYFMIPFTRFILLLLCIERISGARV